MNRKDLNRGLASGWRVVGGPVGWEAITVSGIKDVTNASALSGLLIDFGSNGGAAVRKIDASNGGFGANSIDFYAYDENANLIGSLTGQALTFAYQTFDLSGIAGFDNLRYFQAFSMDGTGGLNEVEYFLDNIMIVAPVPLPAALPFLFGGLGGLVFLRSRKRA